MEPDLQYQQQHQVQQMNSGLTRYRSAPSSYFASFMEGDASDDFLHRRPLSPETERIFARFMNNGTGGTEVSSGHSHDLGEFRQHSPPSGLVNEQPQYLGPIKNELVLEHSNDFSPAPQNFYENQSPTTLARQNSSVAMDYSAMKMLGGSNSNLTRHSSSPAGLFADINVENGLLTTIPQSVNKTMGVRSPDNAGFGEGQSNNFVTGFPLGSWHESAAISENIAGLKRIREDDENKISVGIQNGESGNRCPPMLAHHLSMPNTLAEMSAIEKFLHFQDSVPCKIRAKRGFATHPRSIAERVRRTRISERMRKLQELVPNMDKQTNTSDMLDLAVHYIKDLQQNVKELAEKRRKCTCSKRQQL